MGDEIADPKAWRDRGRHAVRKGLSLSLVLTRNPALDVLIQQGWDAESKRQQAMTAMPRLPTVHPRPTRRVPAAQLDLFGPPPSRRRRRS